MPCTNAHVRPWLSAAWPKGPLWKIEHLMPADRDIHQRTRAPACLLCVLPSLLIRYSLLRCRNNSLIEESYKTDEEFYYYCCMKVILFLEPSHKTESPGPFWAAVCPLWVISNAKRDMRISQAHVGTHQQMDAYGNTCIGPAGCLLWPPLG